MGAAYHGRYMKKNQPVLVSGLTHALVHGLHNALTTGVVHSTAPPLTHAPAGGKSRLLCSPTACTRHQHELRSGGSKAARRPLTLILRSFLPRRRHALSTSLTSSLTHFYYCTYCYYYHDYCRYCQRWESYNQARPRRPRHRPLWVICPHLPDLASHSDVTPPTVSSWYAGPPQLLERTVQGGAQRRPFPECRPGRGRAHQPDHRVAPCRVSDLVARALRACLRAASYERDETDFSTRQP